MTVDTASTPPPFDARALAAGVADLAHFKSVTCVDSVESTNAMAMSMLDDDRARGRSILAEEQTAGRGRAGRGWQSPHGSGLLMSTILPVDLAHQALPALGYWASLCAADAVRESCSVWSTLKWPNDLMLSAVKIAGVLVAGRTIGSFTRAVVGIGINANRPANVPEDLDGMAAWISDAAGGPIDRTALAIELLRTYERRLNDLVTKPVDVIREWSRRSAIAGRTLRVHDASGHLLYEGTARGLSDDGGLILEMEDGPVTVRLGDVSAL